MLMQMSCNWQPPSWRQKPCLVHVGDPRGDQGLGQGSSRHVCRGEEETDRPSNSCIWQRGQRCVSKMHMHKTFKELWCSPPSAIEFVIGIALSLSKIPHTNYNLD